MCGVPLVEMCLWKTHSPFSSLKTLHVVNDSNVRVGPIPRCKLLTSQICPETPINQKEEMPLKTSPFFVL